MNKEEKHFLKWYKENESRFHQGQFTQEQIAYSAFCCGFNYNTDIIRKLVATMVLIHAVGKEQLTRLSVIKKRITKPASVPGRLSDPVLVAHAIDESVDNAKSIVGLSSTKDIKL